MTATKQFRGTPVTVYNQTFDAKDIAGILGIRNIFVATVKYTYTEKQSVGKIMTLTRQGISRVISEMKNPPAVSKELQRWVNDVSGEPEPEPEPEVTSVPCHQEPFDMQSIVKDTGMPVKVQSKLIDMMLNTFNQEELELYSKSFLMYLKYHPTEDYIVDLDLVHEFMGFPRKDVAKKFIVKHFKENEDYNIQTVSDVDSDTETGHDIQGRSEIAPPRGGAKIDPRGGHNVEKLLMNIDTFKDACMLANTPESKKVRVYYRKLENITQRLNEQTLLDQNSLLRKLKMNEKALVSQFPKNQQCIYIGNVGVHDNEVIIKFGESNDLKQRVGAHRSKFETFELIYAFKVKNSKQIENIIKGLPQIQSRKRTKIIKGKNTEELIMLDDDFTITDLIKLIKKIIDETETGNQLLIEQEKTKQILAQTDVQKEQEKTKQEQEKTKQLLAQTDVQKEQEKTKQLQIQLEMMKLELTRTTTTDPEEINVPSETDFYKKFFEDTMTVVDQPTTTFYKIRTTMTHYCKLNRIPEIDPSLLRAFLAEYYNGNVRKYKLKIKLIK